MGYMLSGFAYVADDNDQGPAEQTTVTPLMACEIAEIEGE